MIGFATVLLRGFIVLFAGGLIAGGSLTLAAYPASSQRPHLVAASSGAPKTLIVPQVTGQVYVFSKGILQDGGFAWRVVGPVRGFAGNTVSGQEPSAGSAVLDTGAPTVSLTLARNKSYAERGKPEDAAPYRGTAVRLPGGIGTAAVIIIRPKPKRVAATAHGRNATSPLQAPS